MIIEMTNFLFGYVGKMLRLNHLTCLILMSSRVSTEQLRTIQNPKDRGPGCNPDLSPGNLPIAKEKMYKVGSYSCQIVIN